MQEFNYFLVRTSDLKDEFPFGKTRKVIGISNIFLAKRKDEPTEPRTLQYRFKTILKKLNLPNIHFHALRHMFATNCVSLGFDIKALSEMLSHSGVEITLNRYVHSSFNKKREYMDRLDFAF